MIPSCAQRSLVTGDILAGRATLGDKSAFALTVLGQVTSRVVGKPEVIAQVLTVVTTDLYPSKVAPRRFSKPPPSMAVVKHAISLYMLVHSKH